ncbi:o-succinylbenzoic acid (OSB) synthetase [Oceanisphaera arctica]|uniref:O-succinylbenzoic acid (OSB) synthetase n=1 Tax=Oceanisphaera arctica TaxID=641510 RepID=A0A2P5TJZ6_9GAMM|nr:o-succinylbenzoic acid (OSB) synthetase [Oceanisphaera arctica]PPL15387.1 o-succinylbenzoic acid (OSB) synthetase [Oceanisphaera arctica]GHA29027.1 o-succinylbenzoate synthase [Oceanisphaera arctica]
MQIAVYVYELPLTMALAINGTTLSRRRGFYVDINGHWGEIAPLPGSSVETLAEAEQDLLAACRRLSLDQAHGARLPSVQFGLDCALAGIGGIDDEAAPSLPLLEGAREPIIRAWRCRRVHPTRAWLSLTGDVQFDAGLVRELTLLAPSLRLVLDAGGRLSSEQLTGLWQRIDGERVDWLLNPAADMHAEQQLAEQHGWPVAFDLARYGSTDYSVFDELKALVLRPSQLGGLALCRQLVEQARHRGLELMIADSLESGLGHHQLAWLSQQWNPGKPAALDRLRYLLDSGVDEKDRPKMARLSLIQRYG